MTVPCHEGVEQRLASGPHVLPALYEEWVRLRNAFADMNTITAGPWCVARMREDARAGRQGARHFREYGEVCVFAGLPVEVGTDGGRTLRWKAERGGETVRGELRWPGPDSSSEQAERSGTRAA